MSAVRRYTDWQRHDSSSPLRPPEITCPEMITGTRDHLVMRCISGV